MYKILCALIALVVAVSCSNSTPVVNSEFSVKSSLIEATDVGGDYVIEYQLKSYVGSVMPAAVTDAEWIVDIDNSTKGKISFRVLPNYDVESRELPYEFAVVDNGYAFLFTTCVLCQQHRCHHKTNHQQRCQQGGDDE